MPIILTILTILISYAVGYMLAKPIYTYWYWPRYEERDLSPVDRENRRNMRRRILQADLVAVNQYPAGAEYPSTILVSLDDLEPLCIHHLGKSVFLMREADDPFFLDQQYQWYDDRALLAKVNRAMAEVES